MRTLIICNTPYQILNAVNIIMNRVEGILAEYTDILIDKTFEGAEIIGNRLLKEKICKNLFYAFRMAEPPKRSKVKCLIDLITENYYEELYEFSDISIKMNKYDVLWVGDNNPLGMIIFKKNNKASVYWYDDGISSYARVPPAFGYTIIYEKIASLCKLGGYKYRSKIIYLNNKDLVQYSGYDIRQLPKYYSGNMVNGVLNVVFNYSKERSLLDKYQLIVLTQVLPSSAEYKGIDVDQLFENTNIDFSVILIRKHPRDRQNYEECVVDTGINMWEMECLNLINDEHILISCCSTAQITPKMIAGKEPYIFFLHRILLRNNSSTKDELEKLVSDIKNIYLNKMRVFVPNTVQEFQSQLLKLIKK